MPICSQVAELEGARQQHDGEPHRHGSGNHSQKLDLLLRRRRGAQPVAGLEIGDGLARNRERRAHHAGDGHDEEHAGGTGDAEAQQHDGGNDDGEHGHAGHRVARRGGDGAGRHRGEEERKQQGERHADANDQRRRRQAAQQDGHAQGADHHPEQDGHKGDIAIGTLAGNGLAAAERVHGHAKRTGDDA